jgi:ATP-dependent Lhr-like helicase
VSNFDSLHPLVRHHIANSLGWRSLREFQDAVIPDVLGGRHMIILAPTAGGKTEAAFFPLISRLLEHRWDGLGILYVCPLKALLNNLFTRLSNYCRLLGLSCGIWHGDIGQSERNGIQRDPPALLLTTPESLEVMLLSGRVDHERLFSRVRAVVIDEIHAFAGDDRGWHLLSVLSRITRIAGQELQRIGLSATVGNPQQLLEWMTGGCSGERAMHVPPPGTADGADVIADAVGSLQNAATVISRLYLGRKRLTFVDSRSRVEELGRLLKAAGVSTHLTHSSLSREHRHDSEKAFAEGNDCVIVASSVLELGIDVGDLDRVIQIDSPATIAGFLQRMGRTGRRPDTKRNCLFLATSNWALLAATALIDLWRSGYVEAVVPPPLPLHILAQQIMAIAVQQGGVTRRTLREWLERVPNLGDLSDETLEQLIQWMVSRELLWDDHGLLWFGRQGDRVYGHRNFMELFAVFVSQPVFEIMHGRKHVGSMDELTFVTRPQGPSVLQLGGRAWNVTRIEWKQRVAYVEPAEEAGIARWLGTARPISQKIAAMTRTLLCDTTDRPFWSQRARNVMHALRSACPWLQDSHTVLLPARSSGYLWYTFAGTKANLALASELRKRLDVPVKSNHLLLRIDSTGSIAEITAAIDLLRHLSPAQIHPDIDERAIQGLKFSDCLSPELARQVMQERYADSDGLSICLREPLLSISERGANGGGFEGLIT